MSTKQIPWVRMLIDRWASHCKGDVFQPVSAGQANTLVRFGKAEYCDGPGERKHAPVESARIVPQEETAVMESPKPRKRRKWK